MLTLTVLDKRYFYNTKHWKNSWAKRFNFVYSHYSYHENINSSFCSFYDKRSKGLERYYWKYSR